MDKYEAGYQQQVEDVNEIVSLHKENEQVYEKCKTNYREMKRDVLANRHQFGDAASPLEKELNHLSQNLNSMKNLKKEGNYVQAHNHIMGLNESMNEVQKYMDEIQN